MSVQFFKILPLVVLVHIAALSFIWVGFSVPLPRMPAAFVYQGPLPAGDSMAEGWHPDAFQPAVLDRLEAHDVNRWIRIRELSP